MKVWNLMTRDVWTCSVDESLEVAARSMWDHDIGALPVLDDHARIAGMITDRDICMAAYTQGKPLDRIAVRDAMSQRLVTCAEDADIAEVAQLMRARQVHRIPIVDDGGRMVGIVTLADLARVSQQPCDVSPRDVAATLAAIMAARGPVDRAA